MTKTNRTRRGPQSSDGDLVLDWNTVLLEHVRAEGLDPAGVTRLVCLVNLSMYDAVNGINRVRPPESDYEQFLVEPDVIPGASRPAAANAAAYEALTGYFGVDASFDETSERIGDTITRKNVTAGVDWGEQVATDIAAARETDGHDGTADYDACADSVCTEDGHASCDGAVRIGCYRGARWGSAHLAALDTWTYDREGAAGEAFRPDGPPSLDSAAYAEGLNTLRTHGDARVPNADRPKLDEGHDDPAAIAEFWFGPSGTARPSGRWCHIAVDRTRDAELSLSESTRLFAHLALAVGDAGVATWEAKHHYGYWRPQAAIRNADDDGNPETSADSEWVGHAYGGSPEYPSGLAAFGGAAETVLDHYLDDAPFDLTLQSGTTRADLEPAARSFDSVSDALEESIAARIYTGNHFPFTLDDSRALGEDVAGHVLDRTLQPLT